MEPLHLGENVTADHDAGVQWACTRGGRLSGINGMGMSLCTPQTPAIHHWLTGPALPCRRAFRAIGLAVPVTKGNPKRKGFRACQVTDTPIEAPAAARRAPAAGGSGATGHEELEWPTTASASKSGVSLESKLVQRALHSDHGGCVRLLLHTWKDGLRSVTCLSSCTLHCIS